MRKCIERCPNCDRLATVIENMTRQLIESNRQLLRSNADMTDVIVIDKSDQFSRIVEKTPRPDGGARIHLDAFRPMPEADNEVFVDVPGAGGGMGAG